MQANILIVEDDTILANDIAEMITPFASSTIAHDGENGELLGKNGIFDLAILDLMLPQENGYDVLGHWRTEQHLELPILILTAKDTLTDKLRGFNLGADDYLTKPFHREELIARIKALLKRSGLLSDETLLQVADFTIDLNRRTVTYKKQSLQLNGKEFDLLVYFAQNPNVIITKERIFDRLWGFESETALTVVEVYISNLRKKLKTVTADQSIKTLRNVGYLFEVNK
ncbi:response regulator transcription factor [Loigolactobacillus backii]|uniref:DNA-binding response regulator n=2 Tax=Loigolactobacillus backii TaxID=375175 RepID=A0A192GZG5_9LACO|nr:response regulator transcription factor [Loigolactobacillus backii]ANK58949.1 DNA-binding response regulator [Loigolactobacillus backii]ANK61382.1 DNA-binding response regulator [Loigolactobacillus backii]ANK66385.1 DNA-binding response regulator [Loigolactobacillus backii]ANK69418.1 DNA-binding response regulator [Loigolactobacillus backii]MDA5387757.1 response regulator transcription factor [Loigolactobacillus backii]